MLIYRPFAASVELNQAARNNPPLHRGARGTAVALLQGALIGIYGLETEQTVRAFASEYNCFGSFNRWLSWKKGETIPRGQLDRPAGGRGS